MVRNGGNEMSGDNDSSKKFECGVIWADGCMDVWFADSMEEAERISDRIWDENEEEDIMEIWLGENLSKTEA